jgi:hypothetical protein
MTNCKHKKLLGVGSEIVKSIKVSKEDIQIWRSCTLVSKRIENTSWKIYYEVVWFVPNTDMLTQQHYAFGHFG